MTRGFWGATPVFVTGHTGFKGGWLSSWLADAGARVHGYALPPVPGGVFTASGVAARLASSTFGDIRDPGALLAAMRAAAPAIVLHLAAQPLVRASYNEPVETYATNVLGTVHLLEAVRQTPSVRAVVIVTTDKCYESREWCWPYRESDRLGGADPYSSSKACAELVSAAYASSFLASRGVLLATARAGNVIGGGDRAADRLVPDVLRAADAGTVLMVRSPEAVRPWQHVLEPLAGYVTLAERLAGGDAAAAGAWNFGPDESDARPVRWIVERLCRAVGAEWRLDEGPRLHETHALRLDSTKARTRLAWRPRWPLAEALDRTLSWHQVCRDGGDLEAHTRAQIRDYETTGS